MKVYYETFFESVNSLSNFSGCSDKHIVLNRASNWGTFMSLETNPKLAYTEFGTHDTVFQQKVVNDFLFTTKKECQIMARYRTRSKISPFLQTCHVERE